MFYKYKYIYLIILLLALKWEPSQGFDSCFGHIEIREFDSNGSREDLSEDLTTTSDRFYEGGGINKEMLD